MELALNDLINSGELDEDVSETDSEGNSSNSDGNSSESGNNGNTSSGNSGSNSSNSASNSNGGGSRMIRVPCDEDDEDDGDEEEDEEQEEPGKFSGILGGYRTPNGYGGGSCEGDCDDGSGSWGSDLPWEFELGLELPEPPNLSNLRIKPKHPCWKWILLNKGIKLLDLASDLAILVDIANGPSGEGYLIAMGLGSIKKGLKDLVKRQRSINQINQIIKKGKAPKSIKRADRGKIKGEQDHIHFNDGSAINRNGTFKHGNRTLNKSERKFLEDNGFNLP